MTFEGKAKWFQSGTSHVELIALNVLYVHPKTSNHLRSHSRAIMALDHNRLGLENKFLENKSGRIFLRSTSLLYKILPTNLEVSKPTFYTFYTSHLREYYEALYLSYRPRTKCSISQFFKTNCTQSIFTTINRGLLAKLFKQYTASRFSLSTSAKFAVRAVWSVWMNINRVTLQHNKQFFMLIFLFNGFITMCNLKKCLIRAAFKVLLEAMFMNDWKQTAQRL